LLKLESNSNFVYALNSQWRQLSFALFSRPIFPATSYNSRYA